MPANLTRFATAIAFVPRLKTWSSWRDDFLFWHLAPSYKPILKLYVFRKRYNDLIADDMPHRQHRCHSVAKGADGFYWTRPGSCGLFGLRDYDRGAEFARKVLTLQPNDIGGLFTLVASDYHAARLSDAEATAAQIRERFPHLRASRLRQAYCVKRASTMAKIERAIAFIGLAD